MAGLCAGQLCLVLMDTSGWEQPIKNWCINQRWEGQLWSMALKSVKSGGIVRKNRIKSGKIDEIVKVNREHF